MIGTHVPRQCGIATFTADLTQALSSQGTDVRVIAIDDGNPTDYSDPVRFTVRENQVEDYRLAARWVDDNGFDAVCLQHEFGIFGGEAGSYILELLRTLDCPVVTTLHTVLESPSPAQRAVFDEVAHLSDRLVTMSRRGMRILRSVYGIEPSKILRIPHGTPATSVKDGLAAKENLGLTGRQLLLTFGLLSPDKGIEHAIAAMPAIVERHSEALYIVAGATHPHVRAVHGETYRERLVCQVERLGLGNHVRFDNTFLSEGTLTDLLQAADVVVTPYLKREQITSGVLSRAFASGNAIVSTPFWHAEELLEDGRGSLVEFREPGEIAAAVVRLLADPTYRKRIQVRARAEGAETQWPCVAAAYLTALGAGGRHDGPGERGSTEPPAIVTTIGRPSVFGLERLTALTDDVGLIQHAKCSVPLRREGYCVDDNARSLLLLTRLASMRPLNEREEKARIAALAFVIHAYDRDERRFQNFMSYGREWTGAPFSEDADGRSIAALVGVSSSSRSDGERALATEMLEHVLKNESVVPRMRGAAHAISALSALVHDRTIPDVLDHVARRTAALHQAWREAASATWPWFEDSVTYEGARLCQALIEGGQAMGRQDIVDDGLTALSWLDGVQRNPVGLFRPIGSEGFFSRGGTRALYDQQPVEVWATVDAAVSAGNATDDRIWPEVARTATAWFWGANDQGVRMVDLVTGGAFDGLTPDGPNLNQGAEATLSLLGSTLACATSDTNGTERSGKVSLYDRIGMA